MFKWFWTVFSLGAPDYSECCEPCSFRLVNILIQNVVRVFLCILSLYLLQIWLDYRHGTQLAWIYWAKYTCCTPLKVVKLPLYLPITDASPQRPLSSPPEVVVVERFDCSIKLPHFSMFQQQVVVNWNGHTPYLLAAWVDQRQRGTSSYRPLGFHLSF